MMTTIQKELNYTDEELMKLVDKIFEAKGK